MAEPKVDVVGAGSLTRPLAGKPVGDCKGSRSASVVGASLVVGGGIAGVQAALDLAGSGIKVYLLERSPTIGGKMAQLDKTFPTNDCAMCIISPKLVEAGRHPNIEIIATADLLKLEGEPGNFTATIRRRPRYVDVDKCTACADCVAVCPIHVPSEFNEGLAQRTAIFNAGKWRFDSTPILCYKSGLSIPCGPMSRASIPQHCFKG